MNLFTFTIVLPSSRHESYPSLDSKTDVLRGKLCEYKEVLSSFSSSTFSLFRSTSSPSLGRGSIIFWHGNLGKQGKDWFPVGASKHLPNSNNIILAHAANGLWKNVQLVGAHVVTDDSIQAGRLPTASCWVQFPRGPEKAGQAASHRLRSQFRCPHHTSDRCSQCYFLEKATQGLCCYPSELKGKGMGSLVAGMTCN